MEDKLTGNLGPVWAVLVRLGWMTVECYSKCRFDLGEVLAVRRKQKVKRGQDRC